MARRLFLLQFISAHLLILFLLHLPLRSYASGPPDPQAYVEWARTLGIDSSNVTLVHTPLGGWTVRASRPIKKGDIFL
jgi:hypothetical protein